VCPNGRREQFFWDVDLPGFGVRAFSSGRRIWVVQYRTRVGRTRREALGDLRVVKLEPARAAAKSRLAAVQLGADPQAEAKAARAAITVRILFDRYLEAAKSRQRPRSLVEANRALRKHARALHPLKAGEIDRGDVVEVLEAVASASGLVSANRVRAHLSAAWTWGLRSGVCDGENPVAFTPAAAPERARDRVLTDAELALIWRCTASGSDYHRIVRLLMLTATRREEVGAMAWSEIRRTPSGGVWTIPAARSKNGRPLELPLTPLAAAQLPVDSDRKLVFGRSGKSVFSGWSAAKSRLDAAMARAAATSTDGGATQETASPRPWRLHDLRRTFATWSNDHGVAPHVVEAVLNHVSGARGGVAGVYNHAAYRDQKAAALAAWAEHLARITDEPPSGSIAAANENAPICVAVTTGKSRRHRTEEAFSS
jgi:integrase